MGQALFLSKKAKFSYEPIGVVGVIAPWNYPWSIPFDEVAMALMAGNGVVLKPASLTPLLGERIRETFEKAGLRRGWSESCTAAARSAGRCASPRRERSSSPDRSRSAAGSARSAPRQLKGSVLELGGKDPQIVCADADLDERDLGLHLGRVRERRTDLLRDRAHLRRRGRRRALHRGRRRGARASSRSATRCEWETEIGPMVSRISSGSSPTWWTTRSPRVRSGSRGGPREVPGLSGEFIAPTVLAGVEDEMRIMKEEIFGPVVPIIVVDSEEEALRRANDSNFGLGASVWTKDRAKGERMARRIESGMVWINDHSYTHAACQCSWGGVKESGLGRSHSKFGFYECVDIKLVSWEPGMTRDFWWQPYDRTLGQAVRASARLLYGRNGQRFRRCARAACRLLRIGARAFEDPRLERRRARAGTIAGQCRNRLCPGQTEPPGPERAVGPRLGARPVARVRRACRCFATSRSSCRREETLAVLGPNGAGKTTLLRVLATLLRPTAGEVSVLGCSLPRESWRARGRIGYLGHEPLLYRDLTCAENLRFQARLHGLPGDGAGRIAELLDRVGMSRRADELVRNLSAGMVQRLAVCRAVLHEPELLLLDEPRSHLDPEAASLVEPLIGPAPGRARVIVTHDIEPGSARRTACWRCGPEARSPTRAPRSGLSAGDARAIYGARRERPRAGARAGAASSERLQGDPRQGPAGRAADAPVGARDGAVRDHHLHPVSLRARSHDARAGAWPPASCWRRCCSPPSWRSTGCSSPSATRAASTRSGSRPWTASPWAPQRRRR